MEKDSENGYIFSLSFLNENFCTPVGDGHEGALFIR